MKGKDILCNFDMEDDDDEEDEKQGSVVQNQRVRNKQFDSTAIKRNILHQEEEEDYHNAMIIPTSGKRVQIKLNKNKKEKIQDIPEEKNEDKKQSSAIDIPNHPSIHLLNEFDYTSSEEQAEKQQKIQNEDESSKEQQLQKVKMKEKEEIILPQSTQRSSLLNIDIESSQDDERMSNQSSEESGDSGHREMKKMLSLKPSERQPVTIQDINLTHNPLQDMKNFTQKEIGMEKIFNIKIMRDNSGINSLYPQYKAFFQQNGTKVMIANKKFGSSSSNFYITLESGVDSVTHELFLGKLRANFWNNIYNVYTRGVNPKNATGNDKKRGIEATIVFSGVKENKQPRTFEVFTLAKNVNYYDLVGTKNGEEISLNYLYDDPDNKSKIFRFINRKPVFSKAIEGYILNFGGRVQMASVKNFILEDAIAHREVLMLGKQSDDTFRLDISWPLKPYVGYCIGLASIDSSYAGD